MNKKISVLDLVNMKEDEMPRKIKYRDGIYDYQENEKKYKKEDPEAEVWLDWKTEVEILEDNTEEIEELDEEWTYIEGQVEKTWSKSELELVNKINELVKAVNKLRKENK